MSNPKPQPNHQVYLQTLRRMTEEERLLKAFELSDFSRQLFKEGLRQRFPEKSETELHVLFLKRLEKMSQSELLSFVLHQLKQCHIPYMVTGSVVSSLQGEPRSTHDVDVIVWLKTESVAELVPQFPEDKFYINPTSIMEAIDRQSMFNLIDMFSGNKVDFWLLTDTAYDYSRFARRQKVNILGIEDFYVTSPEDTIISKLRWANLSGGSEKQLIDAIRVFEMQFDRLDFEYLAVWVEKLALQLEWKLLIGRAEPY